MNDLSQHWIFSIFSRNVAGRDHLLDSSSLEEQVRQSILFILSTEIGERPLFPEYGTHLRRYLFRRNTDALLCEMATHVQDRLSALEARIYVEGVKAERSSENSKQIDLIVRYQIKQNDLRQTIRFPIGLLE